jgi:hypothetical protein
MILFLNTILTDNPPLPPYPNAGLNRVHYPYNRGNLSNYNQIEVFKYSLASLSIAYPWSRVIIKVKLENKYLDRKIELKNFIEDTFKNFDLILEWERNEYQQDWINTYELLNNDLIWFCCNHDHIFIDSSTEYLSSVVNQIKLDKRYPMIAMGFSHFPEHIMWAKRGMHLLPHDPSSYLIEDKYMSVDSTIHDSIMIITKDVYYKWWCEESLNGGYFPRPETHYGISIGWIKPMPILRYFIPFKEICRHFDGYGHSNISNDNCPALDIPPGFFEHDIKVRYGYDDYKEEWVNINPKNQLYKADNNSGVDYRFEIDSLPLVWRNKISTIDCNPNLDQEEMITYFLESILKMIYVSSEFEIDKEAETKILNEYLKTYSAYSL